MEHVRKRFKFVPFFKMIPFEHTGRAGAEASSGYGFSSAKLKLLRYSIRNTAKQAVYFIFKYPCTSSYFSEKRIYLSKKIKTFLKKVYVDEEEI
jgi:hypothetical protein